MAGRKIFVGSLPDGVREEDVRAEFERFGAIDDLFVKVGCEIGRQWAMVTYTSPACAQTAKESTDRILMMPGSERPVEVMIARNQGKNGEQQDPAMAAAGYPAANSGLPKKIFVGSLPNSITEQALRAEFSRYGSITDVFLKDNCEHHKAWAFVTYLHGEDANCAKMSTDRLLRVPGAEVPCEVMIARNQGLNGQNPVRSNAPAQQPAGGQPMLGNGAAGGAPAGGPTKIFVGSLPDDVTEAVLRSEFSRFGHILDVYLKTGCETHKQWAFVVFAEHWQAQRAKDETDRRLYVPGARGPCEVMFAKYQGKNGTDPLSVPQHQAAFPAMPAVPTAPPPPSAWRVYHTAQGMPYYHNHSTGVTQWECPPEMQFAAIQAPQPVASAYGPVYGAVQAAPHQTAFRPY